MGVSEASDVESGNILHLNNLTPFDIEPRRGIGNWEGDLSIKSQSSSDIETECERISNIESCD